MHHVNAIHLWIRDLEIWRRCGRVLTIYDSEVIFGDLEALWTGAFTIYDSEVIFGDLEAL